MGVLSVCPSLLFKFSLQNCHNVWLINFHFVSYIVIHLTNRESNGEMERKSKGKRKENYDYLILKDDILSKFYRNN